MRRHLALTGALLALTAPAARAAGVTGNVTEVGDSLGVGTVPHLRPLLPGVDLTADVKVGRPSQDGPSILENLLRADDGAVVFDLGTNDDPANPGRLAGDLAAAAKIAGTRCLIVATLNRPPLNGHSVDGLNKVLAAFAARRPNTTLIPWHRYAAASPGLLGPDHVHPTGTGYELRAKLFARAITDCLTGASSSLPPIPKSSSPGPSTTLTPPPRRLAPALKPGRTAPRKKRRGSPARVSIWTIAPYGALRHALEKVLFALP
jgi:hypothetical protein